MKELLYFISCVFGLILLTGCASTRLTSFRDPDFTVRNFHKILVIVPLSDLESREAAETAFADRLTAHGVEALTALQILAPTRTYTKGELAKILSENKIEGVLIVMPTDAYTKQTYIPRSSSTYGQGTLSGNTLSYSANTQYHGGYSVSKPRVKYELKLFDVPSGKIAWIGTSITRGNAFAHFITMIDSLAATAVRRLDEEGLLRGEPLENR